MRFFFLACVLPAVGACSDATGTLQGGQPIPLESSGAESSSGGSSTGSASGSSSGGSSGASAGASSGSASSAPTWTTLYANYFGNPKNNGCSSLPGQCHQAATDTGVTLAPHSGFVCGT